MGSVLFEQSPFAQCLAHQRNIALRQIAHPAVNQFGAAATGSFGVVMGLEQQGTVSSSGSLHSSTQATGPSSNDEQVPLSRFGNGFNNVCTLHGDFLCRRMWNVETNGK